MAMDLVKKQTSGPIDSITAKAYMLLEILELFNEIEMVFF